MRLALAPLAFFFAGGGRVTVVTALSRTPPSRQPRWQRLAEAERQAPAPGEPPACEPQQVPGSGIAAPEPARASGPGGPALASAIPLSVGPSTATTTTHDTAPGVHRELELTHGRRWAAPPPLPPPRSPPSPWTPRHLSKARKPRAVKLQFANKRQIHRTRAAAAQGVPVGSGGGAQGRSQSQGCRARPQRWSPGAGPPATRLAHQHSPSFPCILAVLIIAFSFHFAPSLNPTSGPEKSNLIHCLADDKSRDWTGRGLGGVGF